MQQVTHFINPEGEEELKINLGTVKSETLSDRDAGFCSGEETDLDTEFHSPTDTSRDSSDTKDYSIEFKSNKNKRKCAEPRKVADDRKIDNDQPQPKLIKLENEDRISSCIKFGSRTSPFECKVEKLNDAKSVSPFRPWNSEQKSQSIVPGEYSTSTPSPYIVLTSPLVQEEPLSLVVDKKKSVDYNISQPNETISTYHNGEFLNEIQDLRVNQQRPQEVVRICESDDNKQNGDKKNEIPSKFTITQPEIKQFTSSSSTVSSEEKRKSSHSNNSQRNYKNMTRERRIEANARERTRVHTISAAFETLRKCVPAYANNQKLSKLSVLRIACSYIMTLSRLAGHDYSIDQSEPSIPECIDNVCNTIQLEGKTRKKKDE